MSSGSGNQEVTCPCSEPEEFSVAEAEQKATYNGLDHEWETGSRQEWTAPPGCGASPVGGGDGTVTANPPGRFYLKAHTHFFSQAYVQ